MRFHLTPLRSLAAADAQAVQPPIKARAL